MNAAMRPMRLVTVMRSRAYWRRVRKIFSGSLIAYWPLWEASGATITDLSGYGRAGTYSNVTLGAAGIGDGHTAASFDGSSSSGDVFGAGLAGAFNSAEGSLGGWFQLPAAAWTANQDMTLSSLGAVYWSNYIEIYKSRLSQRVTCDYVAGGTVKEVQWLSQPTIWSHILITWSHSADAVKTYSNGVQIGATQTGLGNWAGALTVATLGMNSVSGQRLQGNLAHWTLSNRALSAAEVMVLYQGYPK